MIRPRLDFAAGGDHPDPQGLKGPDRNEGMIAAAHGFGFRHQLFGNDEGNDPGPAHQLTGIYTVVTMQRGEDDLLDSIQLCQGRHIDKVIFGLGRYRILDAIRRTGSMHAAAKELHMSYRAVWMRVRSSEKRIGKDLIVREGKGSRLTPFAENMMKQYRRLQSAVQTETDEVYASLITDHLS